MPRASRVLPGNCEVHGSAAEDGEAIWCLEAEGFVHMCRTCLPRAVYHSDIESLVVFARACQANLCQKHHSPTSRHYGLHFDPFLDACAMLAKAHGLTLGRVAHQVTPCVWLRNVDLLRTIRPSAVGLVVFGVLEACEASVGQRHDGPARRQVGLHLEPFLASVCNARPGARSHCASGCPPGRTPCQRTSHQALPKGGIH